VADTRDDICAKRRLSVEGREDRSRHPGAQVHQGAHHRGGSDVERDAEALACGVPCLDRDEVLAREYGRDCKPGFAEHVRERAQDCDAGHHVVALLGQRLTHANHVAALVL